MNMTPEHDLTTEGGLREYLTSMQRKFISVKLLSGGTANYVYQVTFQDLSTAIFKHAAPYLHSNKDFAFDPARMDYEHYILCELPSSASSQTSQFTHAVGVKSYDKEKKLLCLEDGGERNLKEAYDDPTLDMNEIGIDLAKWLATLHLQSITKSFAVGTNSEVGVAENNAIAVNIYRHSYQNLHSALEKYGNTTELAIRINDEFGSLLASDDETVCHGDFWPGNVLVRMESPNHIGSGSMAVALTVVDWEMVRRGISATDVGQFAAEAFLLDRFKGARDLRRSFLATYVQARESATSSKHIGRQWIGRMAVHWAVHIAFWPTRVQWTDDEGTKKLVDIGVGVLNAVLTSDWETLKQSPLFMGLDDEWYIAFARP
jgi:thiamine kinase-like enzyme